jgi:ATP-dependent DNA helicase RecG
LFKERKSALSREELKRWEGLFAFLKAPLDTLKSVGPKRSATFLRLGISCIGDLLYHLPREYEDRTEPLTISQISPGRKCFFRCKVWKGGPTTIGRRKVYDVYFHDHTGTVRGRWFNFREEYLRKNLQPGKELLLYGEVTRNSYDGYLEVIHPQWEPVGKEPPAGVLPLYPSVQGLHQLTIREVVRTALDAFPKHPEYLPPDMVKEEGFLPLKQTFSKTHFPSIEELRSLKERRSVALRRLIFEEFFFFQMVLLLKRRARTKLKGIPFHPHGELRRTLMESLPFTLTEAQMRTLEEIDQDLSGTSPMHRLIQGDVGSGKTIVAVMAMVRGVESGYQVAMMAPTEILAEQHYLVLQHLLSPLGVRVELLVSGLPAAKKREVLQGLREGVIPIVVGTHAVIQEGVEFNRLGLVVVDEQHRFGVMQRAALKEKGASPHMLVMTATPIPRTLSLTLYGDLDVSVIDQMPKGRKPIKTAIVYEHQRGRMYEFLRSELEKGAQVYMVYPLVEESKRLGLRSATAMYPQLAKEFAPFNVGLLHGQMSRQEKEETMMRLKRGEIDLLVATTVIEVGIDVPNATVMVIEEAHRFGLSQLHQLRGRVGRGEKPSFCILMAGEKGKLSATARERLKIIESTTDGFVIAEKDLELRGPGDYLGTRQSGLPTFRLGDIVKDQKELRKARAWASRIVSSDPQLRLPQHTGIKAYILYSGLWGQAKTVEAG